MEHGRWFLWWPVGMGLGITCYFCHTYNPAPYIWWLITAASCVCLGFIRKGGLIPLSFFWGFTAMHWETTRMNTPMLENTLRKQQGIAVVDDIEWRPDAARITCTLKDHSMLQRARFKLKFETAKNLNPGDTIEYVADFFPITPPASPFSYDYRRACFFQGIGATGRLKTILQHTRDEAGNLPLLRYKLTQTLRQNIPGAGGEIAAALITGDRSGIPATVRQAFADAGLAHILAISGLHVSLVAGLIFMLLRRGLGLIPWLNVRVPLKKVAALTSLPFVLGYVAISGFSFPALRSLIMLSLVMTGIMCDRPPFSMRSVMLAASILLSLWPSGLFGVSFQLSFAAVIALLAVYESRFDRGLKSIFQFGHKKLWRSWLIYVLSIGATTIAATLATTPFTVVTFNRFTLQAILGNVIGIPLTGFWIMPVGVMSIFSLVGGGSSWLFSLWSLGIDLLVRLAYWVASLPGSAITVATPYESYLPCVVLAGLWLCLWRTSWRFASIPILIIAHVLLPLLPSNIVLFATAGGIAYTHNHVLYTGKATAFLNEQWAKTLGCKHIEEWTTAWAVVSDNIIVQHPSLRNGEAPNIRPVTRQIIRWRPGPYPDAPTTWYRCKSYGLPPKVMAESTFFVRSNGAVTYLNDMRSPHRPWS